MQQQLPTMQQRRQRPQGVAQSDSSAVFFNKCRPSKPTPVVPANSNIIPSIFGGSKSPRRAYPSNQRAEKWKQAAGELSQRLLETTRKRDEALIESIKLKHAMAALEKKLQTKQHHASSCMLTHTLPISSNVAVNSFLRSTSDARAAVRQLGRLFAAQLRMRDGDKLSEKVVAMVRAVLEVKMSIGGCKIINGMVVVCIEALLNKVLYEEFEYTGFEKERPDRELNPAKRCKANFTAFLALNGLRWEDVLNKGTRHFSQDFSRFCDRKMSKIATMVGWKERWPEALLKGFFSAAKGVWLVHLLAFSVQPGWPIYRVEKGIKFDEAYMEDTLVQVGQSLERKMVPTTVRMMVAPGFYVYSSVIKCKVLCNHDQTIERERTRV